MLVEIAAALFIFLVILSAIGWVGIAVLLFTFMALAILGLALLIAGAGQVAGFFIAAGFLLALPALVNRYPNMRPPGSGF
jgi:hypothetical protein